MATTYTKSYATDFGSSLNESQLHNEIVANTTITKQLSSVARSGDNVDITFQAALDAGESTELDTVCANHVASFDITVTNEVVVKEETVTTNGRFRCETVVFTAAASTTTTHSLSFPFNTSQLNTWTITSADQEGDNAKLHVAPNTVVGTLTAVTTTTDTVLSVSSTVVANVDPGTYVSVTDGTNTSTYSRVSAVGTTTITLDDPIGFVFAVGDTVRFQVETIDLTFGPAGRYVVGDSKIGGAAMPANTVLNVVYTNSTGAPKDVRINIEYLY